ncbi:MAG: primase-like DNA-binding domain-containing protein, partial [Robiginitomaculum sp.]|nr:primase-like DNA-binding domain-containing protein [Robiginitomaculum sp.]
IWRRTKVVPWPVQIAEEDRDKSIDGKLRAEASGVLNWLVDGYYDYLHRDGFDAPEAAQAALDDYRRGSNPFGEWYDERCLPEIGARVLNSSLYMDYEEWAKKNGMEPMSRQAFGKALGDRQHGTMKSGEVYRLGLRLKRVDEL